MNYEEPQRAPADIINGVLTVLICKVLTLRPEHEAKLRARGLSAEEIRRKRYVSAPATREERRRAAERLAPYLDAFGGGVPGFYFADGRWEMAYRPSGFFVAVRNEHGFIQALSQRVDEPRDGGKYIWLSTNLEAEDDAGRQKYPRGASSGTPPHFAGRHLLHEADEVMITEGVLKSEVASYLSGLPVVGVAGTHSIMGLASRLRINFPKLRSALVAYDRDMMEKPQVLEAVFRLTSQLEAEHFRVRVRTWPGPEKGIDDYLLAESRRAEVTA
jgi:DNA primase